MNTACQTLCEKHCPCTLSQSQSLGILFLKIDEMVRFKLEISEVEENGAHITYAKRANKNSQHMILINK